MKKKILVIDDDSLVQRTLANLLTKSGYLVDLASTALEGVQKANENSYDLIISDIRMPGENGLYAIKHIKEKYGSENKQCGYLLISGYAEEDTPSHAIKLGVNRFIFKPFDNSVLLSAIKNELLLSEQEFLLKKGVGASVEVDKHIKVDDKKIKSAHRVVVTGIGVISPSGDGREAYWRGLEAGLNCVSKIMSFDTTDYPAKAAAEARKFDPKLYFDDPTELKRMGRTSHLAVAASKLAVKDAGINFDEKNQVGVIFGSAISGLEYVEVDFRALERGGPRKVRPFLGIAGFAGGASSEISRALGVNGMSLTLSTGCTSSTDAIGYAYDLISQGKNNMLIVGGADACVTPGILAAFCQMGAVSFWKDNLEKASRPFNKDRAGFVIGEGSWMFIFEDLENAKKRGAKIYAEVVGYGATCDAWHMAKPHPSGEHTALAIRKALLDAQIEPEQIDLFEAYGNSTSVNDSYETGVIKKVFGPHAYKLLIPSIKSMLGHPLGASGAQQLAAVCLAFEKDIVHPTINYELPDPECDLNYVPNNAVSKKIKYAVCSSIAFGAKNSAVVLKNPNLK